eukprot:TRINITY_DN5220_c0_g2_i1.p1 TRINITY_DN5220_c0_g2~~TRINITY_DN5220_c0_g2_i1.p1  ORF type:complete len:408 (-),score=108.40 TRINITY_DN5220_c0_g2_i1:310-1533(-)
MGCGATRAKDPRVLDPISHPPQQKRVEPVPIMKKTHSKKSSMSHPKSHKQHDGPANQGSGLMVQKNSVRWKDDDDDGERGSSSAIIVQIQANAQQSPISSESSPNIVASSSKERIQSIAEQPKLKETHTSLLHGKDEASPALSGQSNPALGSGSNPSSNSASPYPSPLINQISNPGNLGEGSNRQGQLAAPALGVLMEQNSSVSLMQRDDESSKMQSADGNQRHDQEAKEPISSKSQQPLMAMGSLASDDQTESMDKKAFAAVNAAVKADAIDDEAAAKIRSALRGQLARKASRGAQDPAALASSAQPLGSPVLGGSSSARTGIGSRKTSAQSVKGKDGTAPMTSIIGPGSVGHTGSPGTSGASPLLIPSSPSFILMKRTGTAATGGTGDSNLNSEMASASDDSLTS